MGSISLVLLLGLMQVLAGCTTTLPPQAPPRLGPPSAQTSPKSGASSGWQAATPDEQSRWWTYILNSPLGIAALNQLAIEGFISPVCSKILYVNQQYAGFETLLQIQCPDERGVSIAQG